MTTLQQPHNTSAPKKQEVSSYAWFVWALGAAFFFSEYFARVGPSVMTEHLMRAFDVGALALGTMSAFFYYPYIVMQIPVGGLVDRFGPHRLMTAMALICGLSSLGFSYSTHLWQAEIARVFMGFSAAFAFVGTLKIATMWFPPSRLGLLAGFTQGLGMLGAAVGEGPFSYLVHYIGWRQTMQLIAVILIVLGILIALFVRDGNPEQIKKNKEVSVFAGLLAVLNNRLNWVTALYAGLLFAPTAAFAELWGASFIHRTYAISEQIAATSISAIFVGWAVGGPIAGYISDKIKRRKPIMYFSALGSLLTIGSVIYLPDFSLPALFVLMFLYGVCNTGVGIAYAVSAEIHPRQFAGISMAFTNMASVLVGAIFQPIIGGILQFNWDGRKVAGIPFYTAHNFRHALVTLPICLALACLVIFFLPETYGLKHGKK